LPGVVEPGNETLDAIFGIKREGANPQPLSDIVPDPLGIDVGDGLAQQDLAVASPQVITSSTAILHGAFSRDNDPALNWGFVAQAAGYTHAGVEIRAADPLTPVYYDAGDAPD